MKGCYQPILITKNRLFNKIKMISYNLRNYKTDLHSDEFVSEAIEVPCGKCLACLSKKSDEWSMRMQHESINYAYGENGMFITLTYNNENLPENYSLRKRDLQLFFKRVRKQIGKRKIKYFACGEYGTLRKRPHYHAIVYGMSYKSKSDVSIINKCWKAGYTHIGYVSQESSIYTAKYMQKDNLLFMKPKEYLALTGKEKPFRVMSKGIGKDFALSQFKNLMKNLKIGFNGTFVSIPRSYLRWYYKIFDNEYIRERLKENAINTFFKEVWQLSKKYNVPMFDNHTTPDGRFYQVINKTIQGILDYRKDIKRLNFKAQNEYYFSKKYEINSLKPLEIS